MQTQHTYPEQKLRERRARLTALKQEVEALAVEVRTLEDVVQHGGTEAAGAEDGAAPADAAPSASTNGHGHWPAILDTVAVRHPRFTLDDVLAVASEKGHEMQRASVRSKLAALVKQGKISRIEEGVFTLPPPTVEALSPQASAA